MQKIVAVLFSVILVGSIPFAFASSDRDAKLEFAGTLEETLGHFWALELNLDEGNSELTLVHATHPIAELYETMSTHLHDNPEFDAKLKDTLLDLQNRANTDVSREQAQTAIDDATQIIEEARDITVGDELSNDPDFKMQLINQLLETAKVEYKEAVDDGIIEEMAEFQDGSAFVWRSQEIFSEFENEIEPIDSARINEFYELVWNGFDEREDPRNVADMIDAVIYEYELLSGIQSSPSEHEEETYGLPPLKQLKEGVDAQDITCKPGFKLLFKQNGSPACVKTSSVQKLISMGWTQ